MLLTYALILIVIISIFNLKVAAKGNFYDDYIGSDSTAAIKGIIVLIVFVNHFSSYVDITKATDPVYFTLKNFVGQWRTAPFLFFSGFGVCTSVMNKPGYIKKMPVNRIWKTAFQFHVALLMYFILKLIDGKRYKILYILKSLISWCGYGNSDWYMFTILVLYGLSYVALRAFEDPKKAAFGTTILSIIMMLFVMRYKEKAYWYNSNLSFAAGMYFAIYKDKIESFVKKSDFTWLLCTFMCFALACLLHSRQKENVMIHQLNCILVCLTVVFAAMKIKVGNGILRYCGNHLFSLFILQRIPMEYIGRTALKANYPLYIISAFVCTLIISFVFDKVVPIVWEKYSNFFLRTKIKKT